MYRGFNRTWFVNIIETRIANKKQAKSKLPIILSLFFSFLFNSRFCAFVLFCFFLFFFKYQPPACRHKFWITAKFGSDNLDILPKPWICSTHMVYKHYILVCKIIHYGNVYKNTKLMETWKRQVKTFGTVDSRGDQRTINRCKPVDLLVNWLKLWASL